ncbi:abortive phage resistance protein AbiGI [Lapidilactobacillus wuchangensis]|uniref:abortive phage resistance protein AbiGI n=1 Tax=Lapidilactobacillus wuchangensis TaxID=2486001 RepID=UPI001CDC8124|nr:abortive phage resistance protein AbiGI [Lapidilactobacillus wuchangensis]
METVNLKVTEMRDTDSSISKTSANALFNFMGKYDFLEMALLHMCFFPRYYPENIKYLNLKVDGQEIDEWYIPMTCFCDIPLHQIAHHAVGNGKNGYGKFGIALQKDFGIKNNIMPVHYLNTDDNETADLRLAIDTAVNMLGTENGNEKMLNLANYLFDYICMVKPLKGIMQKDGKNINKNFYEEHEWRYVPSLMGGDLPTILYKHDEITMETSNHLYTNSLAFSKNGPLNFDVDDIRYLFVDTLENRDRIIRFIREKQRGKRLSKMKKDVLISKILVYDELREDW